MAAKGTEGKKLVYCTIDGVKYSVYVDPMINHNLSSKDPLLKAQAQRIVIDAVRSSSGITEEEDENQDTNNRATLRFCDDCGQGIERGVAHSCPDIQQTPHAECKVCMDKEADCLLLPCHHLATCADCGKKLNKCPICRTDLKDRLKIFRC